MNQIGVQKGRVTSEGDSLYYEVRGQGKPLILIPGAGGDADRYTLVAQILADEYKVITYDRRANARSTMNDPQNFEISQQSRDVVAVLQAVGEQSAYIFGNSSGAVIALDLAKTQPQAVRAVIAHEPPIVRVHPKVKMWQRFYASVYLTSFHFGSTIAALRFLIGTGLPVIQLIKAARAGRSQADMQSEPRISPQVYSDFLIKQELLPVTNYLPDVEGIKRSGVNVIMAAGQESLDKKRWYAETSQILAQRLGCELAVFPGHHGSFMDMPEPWAKVLRNILHKAEAIK
ncbi:MAG: alpha/beta hydrolase [Caldilineaceae bacterium]